MSDNIPIAEHGYCPACGNMLKQDIIAMSHKELACVFCTFKAASNVSSSVVSMGDLERLQNTSRAAWQFNRLTGYKGVPIPHELEEELVQNSDIKKIMDEYHYGHGRGDEDGPYDADCPCRETPSRKDCASTGCGFCKSAEEK